MSDACNTDAAVNLRGKPALFSVCRWPRVVARMSDVELKLTARNDVWIRTLPVGRRHAVRP